MNRTLSKIVAVGAAVAFATALTGCGSDDDKSDKALSVSEFKKQANKLCADHNDAASDIGKDIDENSSDEDVADAIDQTVDSIEDLVSDLEDLNAPDSLKDDVASMLKDVKAGASEMDDIDSLQDLVSFDPTTGVFKDANDKATALGLDKCAE